MGLAHTSDADSLRCLAEAVVVNRKATAVLAEQPILVPGLRVPRTQPRAPQVERDAAQTIRGFAQEFGLTPSARTGVQVKGGDDSDVWNPYAG